MKKVTRLLVSATLIAAGFFFAACSDSDSDGNNAAMGNTSSGGNDSGGTSGGETGSGEATGGETGTTGEGTETGGTSGGEISSGETTGEETTPLETIEGGFVKVPGKKFDGTETWIPRSDVFIGGRAITIRDLIVSDHEVTQKEYETYCMYKTYDTPSEENGKGDNFPAYSVNWYDAVVYCNLRSIAENLNPVYKLGEESDPSKWDDIVSADGKYCGPWGGTTQWDAITMDIEADGYRLPTVAEWEYLARGGKTTSTMYSGSDDVKEVAWYKDNSEGKTHEAKTKKPNALELYDMGGNVDEWCWDWYSSIKSSTSETGVASGSYRCVRGGNWFDNASFCSVSYSGLSSSPGGVYDWGGFRVVRTNNSN